MKFNHVLITWGEEEREGGGEKLSNAEMPKCDLSGWDLATGLLMRVCAKSIDNVIPVHPLGFSSPFHYLATYLVVSFFEITVVLSVMFCVVLSILYGCSLSPREN